MDGQVTVGAADVQVAAKPRRRTYTAEYKRRILKEADACSPLGHGGTKWAVATCCCPLPSSACFEVAIPYYLTACRPRKSNGLY